MNKTEATVPTREETSVDDVRRVRERLSSDFGNDVHKLGEYARKVGDEQRRKLGLKPMTGE